MTGVAARAAPIHPRLGAGFFDPVAAAAFPQTILRYRNDAWAARVGLGGLDDAAWIAHFGRFAPLAGNLPAPLALRYHGHQFRVYNPDIGDGRGFLFAQLRADDGRILDLGTKGSGRTPYSRTGDGRLTLKGGVRELLATAMLEALGVETSKTFSLIETGESLTRSDEPSPTRACVLVRLSHSHIRIGTFQRLAYEQDAVRIQGLVDHVLEHYMPAVPREADGGARAAAMLTETALRVARTGAQWMAAGFVHGVLNTDNINVTGESFDYGPYRFLPVYDPGFTAAYFDHGGLYAYGHQPGTLFWNLQRLAECLMLVADEALLQAALGQFQGAFEDALADALFARLNLRRTGPSDLDTVGAIYGFLHASRMPFERFFFDWHGGAAAAARAAGSPTSAFYARGDFAPVRAALARHAPADTGRRAHPYFAAGEPVTLLIDEIEALWTAIAERDDWAPLRAKLAAIAALRDAYSPSTR
jgi:uncharacterized protein YdiU (UPF0061 family)